MIYVTLSRDRPGAERDRNPSTQPAISSFSASVQEATEGTKLEAMREAINSTYVTPIGPIAFSSFLTDGWGAGDASRQT
ncbi:hypothetical protein, partial [Microbispora hainanensis]|uniref:hypothetical protein n=1 Tax=Microbispora hainanensis TaxID=568844 RepID=UPI0033F94620